MSKHGSKCYLAWLNKYGKQVLRIFCIRRATRILAACRKAEKEILEFKESE